VSTNYPQGQPEPRNPYVQPQPPKKKHTLRNGDKVTVISEFSDGGDLGVTLENAHVKG